MQITALFQQIGKTDKVNVYPLLTDGTYSMRAIFEGVERKYVTPLFSKIIELDNYHFWRDKARWTDTAIQHNHPNYVETQGEE